MFKIYFRSKKLCFIYVILIVLFMVLLDYLLLLIRVRMENNGIVLGEYVVKIK